MGAPKIELTEGEVARLDLKPGDRVALMFPQHLTMAQRQSVMEAWNQWIPDVKAIVLDGGASISTIRQEG